MIKDIDFDDFTIVWKKHALQRMLERSISRAEVKIAIQKGTLIEEYPEDYPYPSCLIAYINVKKSLHIVLSIDATSQLISIITVYEPDTNHFENDLITRRKDEK